MRNLFSRVRPAALVVLSFGALMAAGCAQTERSTMGGPGSSSTRSLPSDDASQAARRNSATSPSQVPGPGSSESSGGDAGSGAGTGSGR